MAKIIAFLDLVACPTTSAARAAEEVIKDIAERVLKISRSPKVLRTKPAAITAARRHPRPHARMAKLVIRGFLFSVRQDLIGLIDLLKFLF